jgi:hypothetical protein
MAFEQTREVWAWLRALRSGRIQAGARSNAPLPAPFAAPGSCATCALNTQNRPPEAGQGIASSASSGVCRLRRFTIVAPALTCCRNFTPSGEPDPAEIALQGAIYSIRSEREPTCLPWVGLIAPHPADGACRLCGRAVANGVGIDLLEGPVFTCGTGHYYEWWGMFLEARLGFFRDAGERAYREMCDAISPLVVARYKVDAVDAFQAAISMARDLEWPGEIAALEARLEEIESVLRSRRP